MTEEPIAADVKVERFDDAMIDIETFSTHTTRAFIVSFAIIPFKLMATGPKFGVPMLILPDALEQIGMGRKIEEKTVQWWADQSKEAREHWVNPDFVYDCSNHDARSLLKIRPQRVSARIGVANYLKDFWDERMTPDATLWANGIVFDVGNIENLIDCDVPWKYNAARDSRTVNRKNVNLRELPDHFEQTHHDPISDCVWQTWDLWTREVTLPNP